MIIAGWIIFSICSLLTLQILYQWLKHFICYLRGQPIYKIDYLGICTYPLFIIFETIVLVCFIYLNVNKLHLLYVYPLVYILTMIILPPIYLRNVDLNEEIYIRGYKEE